MACKVKNHLFKVIKFFKVILKILNHLNSQNYIIKTLSIDNNNTFYFIHIKLKTIWFIVNHTTLHSTEKVYTQIINFPMAMAKETPLHVLVVMT